MDDSKTDRSKRMAVALTMLSAAMVLLGTTIAASPWSAIF